MSQLRRRALRVVIGVAIGLTAACASSGARGRAAGPAASPSVNGRVGASLIADVAGAPTRFRLHVQGEFDYVDSLVVDFGDGSAPYNRTDCVRATGIADLHFSHDYANDGTYRVRVQVRSSRRCSERGALTRVERDVTVGVTTGAGT